MFFGLKLFEEKSLICLQIYRICFIFTDDLRHKLSILSKLDICGKTINDFVPLLEAKADRLEQICELIAAERNQIPGGNRIYYFSSKLKVF